MSAHPTASSEPEVSVAPRSAPPPEVEHDEPASGPVPNGEAKLEVDEPAAEVVEPVLEIRDLSVAYGGKVAVRDVDLDIARQGITAIIGPSGCGKSTFLRSINRMNDLVPSCTVTGSINYHGVDLYDPVVDPVEVRRRIGMVFQKPNPFPKSIHENVAYGPKLAGVREDLDDRVEHALRQAALWDEVTDRLNSSALGLSGGQQQRLCIARALAVEPEVLLMDEPCSALDPIATARIEELMVELTDRVTIVIVTHNMQQAARVERPHRVLHHRGRRGQQPHGRADRGQRHRSHLRVSDRRAHRAVRHREVRMNELHTRKDFGEQLAAVHEAVVQLGEMVCDTVPEATRTLLESDLDGARRLIEGDDVLDALTIEIEERCFQLLVLQSPMASDLRVVVTALRLASEIERCGDLATNIAKTARKLYYADLDPKLRGMLDRMSKLAERQLRFAIAAYDFADQSSAAALDDLDDELDNLQREFMATIFETQRAEALDLRVGVQLALVGRFYERLGDHAVNVGERVQYQVTGWVPEHDGAARAQVRHVALPGTRLAALAPIVDRGVVVEDEAERRRVEALRRDFVANIGHELRTPVGALAVLAETLRSEVDQLEGIDGSPTVRRLSERLTYEAERLGRTIDDLLELSRIEAGEQLVPASLLVAEVLQSAVERVAPAAELAGVRVEVTLPDPDANLGGDRRQLESALANLIDNAVKYSEAGGVVEVRVESDREHQRFVVRDHGIGIPSADQVRIFERFYRVDRARRRDTGGTGLGLAIVRHVALNHGGTIEVSSTEGQGATFTLTLPTAAAAAADAGGGDLLPFRNGQSTA